jgi:hypothetical protein
MCAACVQQFLTSVLASRKVRARQFLSAAPSELKRWRVFRVSDNCVNAFDVILLVKAKSHFSTPVRNDDVAVEEKSAIIVDAATGTHRLADPATRCTPETEQ